MFVTFEGVEGSGKSTLLAAFDRALVAMGHATLETREPGGTDAGDAIREIFLKPGLAIDPLTETLLVNASRAQLVHEVIRPALARGALVLCDRYIDSTVAYQGYGRGLPLETVRELCAAAAQGVLPDLTFVVDVSPETSLRRLRERGTKSDRIELANAPFHERVREGFLRIAATEPRAILIDGERSQAEMLDAALAAFSALGG